MHVSAPAGTIAIQRSNERYAADHGWLRTRHSFSFADYYDPANINWGALRVFNHDSIEAGRGFGTHPHRDMEILTYVLDGELEHRDTLGNVGIVQPGGVQYLSAGTGIAHSEHARAGERPLELVQMWVLPRAAGLRPNYGQVEYTLAERRNRWLAIASGRAGVPSRIKIEQDAACYVARLESVTLAHQLGAGRFAFLFVARGEVRLDGQTLQAGDAARIAGPHASGLAGSGEVVLWDVPALAQAAA